MCFLHPFAPTIYFFPTQCWSSKEAQGCSRKGTIVLVLLSHFSRTSFFKCIRYQNLRSFLSCQSFFFCHFMKIDCFNFFEVYIISRNFDYLFLFFWHNYNFFPIKQVTETDKHSESQMKAKEEIKGKKFDDKL